MKNGTFLVSFEPLDGQYFSSFSEAVMRALRSIHKAGVRHRDIRPQNIVINSNNQVSIIDFDCADLNPSPKKIQEEDKRMEDLLNGRYVELDSLPL